MRQRSAPLTNALQAAFPAPQSRPADALQPLGRGDVLSLQIAHADTLAQILSGQGTAQTLWDWAANVLMWSHAADLAGLGQDDMGEQLQLCLDLIARWRAPAAWASTGPACSWPGTAST